MFLFVLLFEFIFGKMFRIVFIMFHILNVYVFTLTGCPSPGYYGENCSLECPKNCQERHCHITDGTCLGCLPGNYGENCSFECPHNCMERLCKTTEGTCFGCEPGYLGPICKRGTSLNYTFCRQQFYVYR